MIKDLLLNIISHPIGPNMPSLKEILCNCTEERPGGPLHPVDFEKVCNYLTDRKATQKENHDWCHNTKPLPTLHQGQEVLLLSHSELTEYTEGTITVQASTPRSYIIKTQGRTYQHTHQHICSLNRDITLYSRPSTFKDPMLENNMQQIQQTNACTSSYTLFRMHPIIHTSKANTCNS